MVPFELWPHEAAKGLNEKGEIWGIVGSPGVFFDKVFVCLVEGFVSHLHLGYIMIQ